MHHYTPNAFVNHLSSKPSQIWLFQNISVQIFDDGTVRCYVPGYTVPVDQIFFLSPSKSDKRLLSSLVVFKSDYLDGTKEKFMSIFDNRNCRLCLLLLA